MKNKFILKINIGVLMLGCIGTMVACGSNASEKQREALAKSTTQLSGDVESSENDVQFDGDIIRNQTKTKGHENDLVTLKYTDKTEEGYIDKCIFLGDSRTVGFGMTSYLRKGSWLADIGITHIGAQSMKYSTKEGNTYTFDSYLESHQSSVVYVCYGVNGINTINEEQYKKQYEALIDKIKNKMPRSKVVIVSILPVRDDGSYKNVLISEDVRHYNDFLYDLAEKKDVFYLDLYELIADESGQMNTKYDSGDGLHFASKAYDDIYDYIIHHPVLEYDSEGLNDYPKENMLWHSPVKKKNENPQTDNSISQEGISEDIPESGNSEETSEYIQEDNIQDEPAAEDESGVISLPFIPVDEIGDSSVDTHPGNVENVTGENPGTEEQIGGNVLTGDVQSPDALPEDNQTPETPSAEDMTNDETPVIAEQ